MRLPRLNKKNRGQSTIEYILMVGFGAVLAIQIGNYLNGVFKEGLQGLEKNVQSEMATGKGFGN
jgi:Flp pilus assembly pilin Flp